MKIGIDARLINQSGVGRYIRNLVYQLSQVDKKNRYVVFLDRDAYSSFALPGPEWEKRPAFVRWHTLKEQIVMPFVFLREKLDLVHIPYFTVPVFYPGKKIATIHDLTILHLKTGRASTLPAPLYYLRRLGYRIVINATVRLAKHIITVSETTKRDILEQFRINPGLVSVTYEGVDKSFLVKTEKFSQPLIKDPYFLYVGNAYPHKNLENLIQAFGRFLSMVPQNTKVLLVLVGKDDYFYRRLDRLIKSADMSGKVMLFGPAADTQLVNLYSNAIALAYPSLIEGFGLPAIEALACNCPVICSDIPVFREILGDLPDHFDPENPQDIATKLFLTYQKYTPDKREKTGFDFSRFNWQKMAEQTLRIYESAGHGK